VILSRLGLSGSVESDGKPDRIDLHVTSLDCHSSPFLVAASYLLRTYIVL
jgi:hypothetical protein